MSIFKLIVLFLVIIDVFSALISFIDWIPIGRHWSVPRLPLVLTLIAIILQTKQRNRVLYCEKCHKNLSGHDLISICQCGSESKVKFIDFSGKLRYKCKNKNCRKLPVKGFNNYSRTTFSKINPYSSKTQERSIVCKVCKSKLSGESVINLTLYAGDIKLAKDFREDFFYHGFGAGKKSESLSVTPINPTVLKEIDRHYEKGSSRLSFSSVSEEPIQIHFKTNYKNVNETMYQFSLAIAKDDRLKLRVSEGIILLLDGNVTGIDRQTVVDRFLLELKQLNTNSAKWQNPILVGICSNDVPVLESAIESKKVTTPEAADSICRQFLEDQGNGDLINLLYNNITSIHFFLYRTGSMSDSTHEKVYNVVNPVQAIVYTTQSEMKHIWSPDINGVCPKTIGQR